MDEHRILIYIFSSAVVLGIIILVYSRFFGSEMLIESTKNNLTPEMTIDIKDENVKVTVVPLADGYQYDIIAQPEIEIDSKTETPAIAIIAFKDQNVKAKVTTATGNQENSFNARDGRVRYRFDAQISSYIPPLQEWTGRPFENNIPVFIKSNTGIPIVVKARTKEVIDIDSGFDLTPLQECKTDFEIYCDTDLQYTRYLKPCGTEDPRRICEQTLTVCGGTIEIRITDPRDCAVGKTTATIDYKDGSQWQVGESVGISFWKDTDCTKKTSDFKELLVLCANDRLGGGYMNAGLIT